MKGEKKMGAELMARRTKRSPQSLAIAQAILEQYQPKTAEDVQNALKDAFGPLFEAMLQGEMNAHLGYESNNHDYKETDNRRNGYIDKTVKTTYGEVPLAVPRASINTKTYKRCFWY